MIPILYEKDEMLFVSNGLGRLRDAISVVCVEERNGLYELDIEYPVTGSHFDDIQCGRIIGVQHDDTDDIQPFDIVSCSRPINGVVSFHCTHISYRLSKYTANGTNISSLANAFAMLENSTPGNPFSFWSEAEPTGYMSSADGVPKSVRQFLGGVEGSILDAYGGEYEWDKFTVRLWTKRGQLRDLTIRYGVNLTGYNEDVDYSSTYTACVPYWTSTDGTVVVGDMVDSGAEPFDGRTSCIPLDLTDKFENRPSTTDLENMASSIMSSEQPYLPEQTISVDFIRLQDSPEYAQYSSLMECKLCDTINVVFPRYNMSGKFKIVKTTYDVLLERFTGMELGVLSVTLAEALGITSGSSGSKGGGGNSGWTLVTTSSGGNSKAFTDLSAQGYTEIFVKCDTTAGAMIPVAALPTLANWGGYHSNSYGSLYGIQINLTSMQGKYAQVDSQNQLNSRTWYLYAR